MVPITQLNKLPKISGVYKVVNIEGEVLYIGQAKNIYERWNNGHHQLANIIALCGSLAYIEWVQIPEWLLNRAEHVALIFYKPTLNKKNAPVV
jgi:excinuclease UvrABC nuclease subunit